MARVEKIICDRCGKEEKTQSIPIVINYDKDYDEPGKQSTPITKEADLCKRCLWYVMTSLFARSARRDYMVRDFVVELGIKL